ncbi:hypothetical protein [Aestuariivirga sp.]|uniref:hypothetical protein n=1 Tax=Aestuariivirga sp. TaxID=2650926 RepID=UPI0039E3849F
MKSNLIPLIDNRIAEFLKADMTVDIPQIVKELGGSTKIPRAELSRLVAERAIRSGAVKYWDYPVSEPELPPDAGFLTSVK